MPKVSIVTAPEEIQGLTVENITITEQVSSPRRFILQGHAIHFTDILAKIKSFDVSIILLFAIAVLMSSISILGEITPFGLAFFAVSARYISTGGRLITACGLICGTSLIGHVPEAILYALACIVYFRFYNKLNYSQYYQYLLPGYVVSCIILSSTIIAIWQNKVLYDFLVSLLSAGIALISTYIFLYGVPLILHPGKINEYKSQQAYLAAIFTAVIIIAGLNTIPLVGCNLKNIFGTTLVLLIALIGGAGFGASAGIALGMVMGSISGNTAELTTYYGLCGILAGSMRDFGKVAAILAYMLGAVLTIFSLGYVDVLLKVSIETCVGALICLLIPKMIIEDMKNGLMKVNEKDKVELVDKTSAQINQIATIFHELGINTQEIVNGEKEKQKNDSLNEIVSAVTKEVCEFCSKRTECWDRDFYPIYQAFLDTLAFADKAEITARNLQGLLKEQCLNKSSLVQCINIVISRNRSQKYWHKKLCDAQQLAAEQIKAISTILENLTCELKKGEAVNQSNLSYELMARARLLDIPLQIKKAYKEEGSLVLEVTKKPCKETKECIYNLLPLVSGLAEEKMTLAAKCGNITKNKCCELTFKVAERFEIETGIIAKAKEGNTCGDVCSIVNLSKGRIALMLSDGMGSGPEAANESSMAVKFLEKLLTVGFNVDVAVKTVNSLLVLKGSDGKFATIDMVIIDTYTGGCEFLKIGSAPSFVKRVREVATINSANLPVGVLEHIEIEPIKAQLLNKDMLIMVSDGIIDAVNKGNDKEPWLANFLRRMDDKSAKEIAKNIIEETIKLNHGIIKDDMSVLVAKIKEKKV